MPFRTQPTCCVRRGVRFRHGSLFRHQATPRLHCLCGIGIVAYVATFLVGIFHLNHVVCVCVRSVIACSCWRSKVQSLSYVRCFIGSLSLSITFSKEGRGWKVGGTVTRLSFATRSIAHHEINLLNQQKLYFPVLKPSNLKESRVWRLR